MTTVKVTRVEPSAADRIVFEVDGAKSNVDALIDALAAADIQPEKVDRHYVEQQEDGSWIVSISGDFYTPYYWPGKTFHIFPYEDVKREIREKKLAVAVKQALRYEFEMTFSEIAAITGVSRKNVSSHVYGKKGSNVRHWENRTMKQHVEAIDLAEKLRIASIRIDIARQMLTSDLSDIADSVKWLDGVVDGLE